MERGKANHGWLRTFHSFSFASYFDPRHMGFRNLRVINEDWIKGGKGFGTHPHENMEIVTCIISGELEHKDSMGNGSVIRQGELQRMTAGTGVTHSEFNPSDQETHLLQIWIHPAETGLEPGYEQRDFSHLRQPNTPILLASREGRNGSLTIHQDADIFGVTLEPGKQIIHNTGNGRGVWIQVVEGNLIVNGVDLETGDGAAIEHETSLTIAAAEKSEFLLFDLA
jgi:redox-sensitive bicupin YhaK (pirin superfamily)